MNDNIINDDGSIKGKTFSGPLYNGEFPTPNWGKETYRDYYNRVEKAKKEGFHLGDLSWDNYYKYCNGHPYNEEYRQDDIIE